MDNKRIVLKRIAACVLLWLPLPSPAAAATNPWYLEGGEEQVSQEEARRAAERNVKELEKALEEVAREEREAADAGKSKRQKQYEKEREMGEPMHRQVIAQMGRYRNNELQEYVQQVGNRVAASSSRPDMEFTFTIVDDPMVNAFAIPGGYIYLARGILAHLNSEAELAAVLGHEIAHVTERHHFRSENRARLIEFLTILTAVTTGAPAGIPELGMMLGGVLMQGFSREFELEADEVGARFMAKAGYSPEAMLGTIEVLKANEKLEYEQARAEKREPRVYHGFLATHPDADKRYEQTIREADSLKAEYDEIADEGEFLEILEGMTFGDTSFPGVVRRNVYYHPRIGIKLTFPVGWSLQGQPLGVLMVSPYQDAALELSSRRMQPDLTPREFLTDALKLRMREGREFSVAEMPGYIGIADRAQTPFGLKPIRVAVVFDDRRQQAYVLAGSGKNDLRNIARDKEFIGAIFSLSKMTSEDYRNAKTPRIGIVKVDEGVTIDDLAENSPITTYAAQKLRVINGLYPAGEAEEGQLIKVVE